MRVVPMTLREANDFVENFHRHNARTARDGGKWAIGASTDELVAVAIVGNPLSATYMDGFTAEVLRTCAKPTAPRNCNSFLYGACWRVWRAMGGRKLITYTLQAESGASLRGAGWEGSRRGSSDRGRVAQERPSERPSFVAARHGTNEVSMGEGRMSRWHREHPEHYERCTASATGTVRPTWSEPIKQVSPDRAVITDDDREMCRACGELPATRGMYCRRCDDSITEDRLERRDR